MHDYVNDGNKCEQIKIFHNPLFYVHTDEIEERLSFSFGLFENYGITDVLPLQNLYTNYPLNFYVFDHLSSENIAYEFKKGKFHSFVSIFDIKEEFISVFSYTGKQLKVKTVQEFIEMHENYNLFIKEMHEKTHVGWSKKQSLIKVFIKMNERWVDESYEDAKKLGGAITLLLDKDISKFEKRYFVEYIHDLLLKKPNIFEEWALFLKGFKTQDELQNLYNTLLSYVNSN